MSGVRGYYIQSSREYTLSCTYTAYRQLCVTAFFTLCVMCVYRCVYTTVLSLLYCVCTVYLPHTQQQQQAAERERWVCQQQLSWRRFSYILSTTASTIYRYSTSAERESSILFLLLIFNNVIKNSDNWASEHQFVLSAAAHTSSPPTAAISGGGTCVNHARSASITRPPRSSSTSHATPLYDGWWLAHSATRSV